MIGRLVTGITFSLVAALPALAIEGAREVFPAPETPKMAVIPVAGSVSFSVRVWFPSVWVKWSSSITISPSARG